MKTYKMKTTKIMYWLPRILAILIIIFFSIFSLDVFGEYKFPLVLGALFMHLIPSFLLIISLMIAWKKEKIGGIIFIILSIITIFFFNTYQHLISLLIITLPILITGILFLLNKKCSKST